jgi:6-phosphofructokinase
LSELVSQGAITQEQRADDIPTSPSSGLVGSIDNDMLGTDMTIGADSVFYIVSRSCRRYQQHGGESRARSLSK